MLSFLIPAVIRAAAIALVVAVYSISDLQVSGIALLLGAVLMRTSFGADFERLERKVDFLFFSAGADKDTVDQYERLHQSAFTVPRPEPFTEEMADFQRPRSAAFTLIDIATPFVWGLLVLHYIVRIIGGN